MTLFTVPCMITTTREAVQEVIPTPRCQMSEKRNSLGPVLSLVVCTCSVLRRVQLNGERERGASITAEQPDPQPNPTVFSRGTAVLQIDAPLVRFCYLLKSAHDDTIDPRCKTHIMYP